MCYYLYLVVVCGTRGSLLHDLALLNTRVVAVSGLKETLLASLDSQTNSPSDMKGTSSRQHKTTTSKTSAGLERFQVSAIRTRASAYSGNPYIGFFCFSTDKANVSQPRDVYRSVVAEVTRHVLHHYPDVCALGIISCIYENRLCHWKSSHFFFSFFFAFLVCNLFDRLVRFTGLWRRRHHSCTSCSSGSARSILCISTASIRSPGELTL